MTYLDHNAGTPLHPEVADFLASAFRTEPAGNPSSVHGAGRAARARLDEARARVASVVGRTPREILFTSSGSEACATAVLGLGRGGTLVTSAIEHPSVLLAAAQRGTAVVQVRPGPDGQVAAGELEAALGAAGVAACALQAANNETGVVQPAEEMARSARARGVVSFVDAVQAPGRLPAAFEADVVAYSAHKFGGPAGVGMLAVRRGVRVEPLVPGHQEGGRRGGTPSVVLCEAAALAMELAERERSREVERLAALRRGFEEALGGWRVRVHGTSAVRLCNTSNVCFVGRDAETVLIALDLEGFAVSVGAACASGTMRASPVLLAMGLSETEARSSIRFSFGRGTTEAELTALVRALERVVDRGPDRGLPDRGL
ncbi:MAG TPA: cysteine desulfurase family protein [Myxococcaceae bacterium]|nr:cysteine desulfurase family protein [Myxococcaceae bacterium]